jgi:hypothetical protein
MRNLERPALPRGLTGALIGLLLPFTALVQAAPPPSGEEPPQPPPEALQACQSLAKGAACEISTPRGKLQGHCGAPEGKPLACQPKDMPGQGPQGQRPKGLR